MAPLTRQKLWIAIPLFILIPLGLWTKLDPPSNWVGHYLGDVVYEIFWCLLIALLFFSTSHKKITLIVFVLTSFIELLQLWQPPILASIRTTFIGHAILGSNFDPWDFPHYALGCLIAYVWLQKVKSS